ncbi:putative hydroxymethylpyrimidine transport system permease protein [Kushneria avicenniae]|uniref:Putative hydroxymethylpyrimidine transport system permease protein n=1 Tax=Kushneria avicenniae TaxID=402385 RepID=A0A1I1FRF7_9GAMM|nr:ABC transporter permease [Kushneria avicenniae]SFC00188.1 putative hydroxymethylpyrimidine transport system permease protein [Kushneria avicenniae]
MIRSLLLPAMRLVLATALLVGLWQLVVLMGAPRYMLPAPSSVVQTLVAQSALLWHHALVTLGEIVAGFLCGTLLGIGTALILSRWAFLRSTVLPLLLLTQAIPVFAIAPLLVLWFGYGPGSKVVMATLIIYFPIASTCYDGLRQTQPGWLDLAATMGASANRRLFYIRLPAALPSLASGLRMAATAAPIGAIIGEWVGSSAGLGYLMLQANGRMQTDLMFAALIVLLVITITLYFTVDRLCRLAMPWQPDRTGRQTLINGEKI